MKSYKNECRQWAKLTFNEQLTQIDAGKTQVLLISPEIVSQSSNYLKNMLIDI